MQFQKMSPWTICRPVTAQSTDYWLHRFSPLHAVNICTNAHMCVGVHCACVSISGQCVCQCAQPEISQVKDREYQLRPAASFCTKTHFMLHITVTQSVLDEGTNATVTGRRILFYFCSGNNFRDLFSLQVPVWIGGRGNRFCSTHNN